MQLPPRHSPASVHALPHAALARPLPDGQVRVEHTDLGGSFVRPQSGKDVQVDLVHCEQRGVVLTIGLKPRPVSCLA